MSQTGILRGSRIYSKGPNGRNLVYRELVKLAQHEVSTIEDLNADDQAVVSLDEEKMEWVTSQWLDSSPLRARIQIRNIQDEIAQRYKMKVLADIAKHDEQEQIAMYEALLTLELPENPEDAMVAGKLVRIDHCISGCVGRTMQMVRRRPVNRGQKPLALLEERPVMLDAPRTFKL